MARTGGTPERGNPEPDSPAQALADGLAAHVERWALRCGAAPGEARHAHEAALRLALAVADGHVCLDLWRLCAADPEDGGLPAPDDDAGTFADGAPPAAADTRPRPANPEAWRERLVAAGAEAPPPPASKRRGRRNAADKP